MENATESIFDRFVDDTVFAPIVHDIRQETTYSRETANKYLADMAPRIEKFRETRREAASAAARARETNRLRALGDQLSVMGALGWGGLVTIPEDVADDFESRRRVTNRERSQHQSRLDRLDAALREESAPSPASHQSRQARLEEATLEMRAPLPVRPMRAPTANLAGFVDLRTGKQLTARGDDVMGLVARELERRKDPEFREAFARLNRGGLQ